MMQRTLAITLSLLLVTACAPQKLYDNDSVEEARVTDTTKAGQILSSLPLPKQAVPIVVYEFQDQTGQFKNNELYAEYSSAVTKGGLSVLMKALWDTGNNQWFLISERGSLDNLIKERQIIRSMRAEYTDANGNKLPDLPPLTYGGLLIEGGIVFYDSNVLTGGAAAGYFGFSTSAQYRRDIVSIYLRGIDINSGRVVLAVNSSKTVFSYALSGGVTHYLTFDRLLEAETGYSVNEPSQIAVRQAVETAVYSMVMEGAMRGLWQFKDPQAGKAAIDAYLVRKQGATAQLMPDNAKLVPTQAAKPFPSKAPTAIDAAAYEKQQAVQGAAGGQAVSSPNRLPASSPAARGLNTTGVDLEGALLTKPANNGQPPANGGR